MPEMQAAKDGGRRRRRGRGRAVVVVKSPRALVSKQKRRYVDEDGRFDLDLSYIGGGRTGADGSGDDEEEGGSDDDDAVEGEGGGVGENGTCNGTRRQCRRSLLDANGRSRIIAMGYPAPTSRLPSSSSSQHRPSAATNLPGLIWRNPLPSVRSFLDAEHGPAKYAIYNLCSERTGGPGNLEYFHASLDDGAFGRNNDSPCGKGSPCTRHFGFDDRNPPPLDMIPEFCASVDRWLDAHPDNVAAVHCRAGKGRTGTVIAAYLLHVGRCRTAEEALQVFGRDRTIDGRGVTIPSQMRYVGYWERVLGGFEATSAPMKVVCVRLVGGKKAPNFAVGGGCDPFLMITEAALDESRNRENGRETFLVRKRVAYDQREHQPSKRSSKGKGDDAAASAKIRHIRKLPAELDCSSRSVVVRGDVKVQLYHRRREKSSPLGSHKKEMCRVWFHTGFVREDGRQEKEDKGGGGRGRQRWTLKFGKDEIDLANKDRRCRHFHKDFGMEIVLEEVVEKNEDGKDDDDDGNGGESKRREREDSVRVTAKSSSEEEDTA